MPSDAPWKTYTFTFDTTRDARLKFIEQGPSDQQGNILDNVSLSDGIVPEPATWAMMLARLFGLAPCFASHARERARREAPSRSSEPKDRLAERGLRRPPSAARRRGFRGAASLGPSAPITACGS